MRSVVPPVALLFAACISCDSLWQSTLTTEPRNCISNPTACRGDEACSATLEVCRPQPRLVSATPELGPSAGGPLIMLGGSNLDVVTSVHFGAVTVMGGQTRSATQLATPLPPGTVGPVPIVVASDDGIQAVRDDLFRYYASTIAFSAATDSAVPPGPEGLVLADLDRDRHLDVVVASLSGAAVTVYRGKGDGTFSSALSHPLPLGPSRLVAADWDDDGTLDLAVSNFLGDRVDLLFGNGDGTFRDGTTSYPMRKPLALAAVDLNGDGRRDLIVVGIMDSFVSVFLSQGGGRFAPRQDSAIPDTCGLYDSAVGDLDADGRLDVVVRCTSNDTVYAMRGLGNGKLVAFPGSWSVGMPYLGIGFVALADINRDGRLDLIAPSPLDGIVHLLLGRGDGSFGSATSVLAGAGPLGVSVADINLDGWLDLVVGNTSGDTIQVLLGRGGGQFAPSSSVSAAGGKFGMATGDLNEDGLPDIAGAALGGTSFSVLLNRSH